MSVQVSYKKQILLYSIFVLIIFSIVEIFSSIIVKPTIFEGCANRLTASEIYPDYPKTELKRLCGDYYETNVFMSDDRSTIIQFPFQHSKSVNINSFGLRGEEITLEKSKDITRIVMLGGSTTFGWYALDDDDTIPSHLQKIMNQNENEMKFEVINAGHPSASSSFETKFLKEVLKFEPDIIIVYDGYNEITAPLPMDIPESKMQLQIFFKQLDAYSYTPRLVQKFLHKINSDIFLQVYKKPNTVTVHYTEEDYVKRADLWEKRWLTTCDELVSEDLKIIVFLQPFLGTSDRIMTEYETKIMHENAKRDLEHYYLFKEKVSKIDSRCTLAIDISDTFDNINKPIFSDLAHTGNFANKVIAERIYEEIQPIIQ